MFLQGYFYWSGVVANAMVLFWFVVGGYLMFKEWDGERKNRKKIREEKCEWKVRQI